MKVAAAKRTLEAAAAKYGATVEDDSAGNYVTFQVIAPEGKLWSCDSISMLCVTTARGLQSWLDDSIKDAIERMAYGIEDAPEDDES